MKITRKLWVALLLLALCSPLGLLLPTWLGAGSAWGEWSPDELRGLLGYVPAQLARLSDLWHAPLPDYAGPGGAVSGLAGQSLWYIVSALIGLCLVAGLSFIAGRWLARHEHSATAVDD